MRRAPHPYARHAGFSLVETLLVVALLALTASGMSFALGAVTRTHLRSACMRVTAAARFAYTRAIVKGNTVRVQLNADKHTIALQEAHGKVKLAAPDDERRQEMEGSKHDRAAVDPWEAARARLEKSIEPTFGRSPFGPIRSDDGTAIQRYKAEPVGEDIRVAKMFLPHEPEPVRAGTGSIYFFPGGRTEHAIIQLTDGEAVYSVEIQELTGRARIHSEAYEPENFDGELLGEPPEESSSELEGP